MLLRAQFEFVNRCHFFNSGIVIAFYNTRHYTHIFSRFGDGSVNGHTEDEPIAYVTLLEKTNLILLEGLRKSTELLSDVTETVSDSSSWKDLVQQFRAIISLGEEVCAQRSSNATEKVSIVKRL